MINISFKKIIALIVIHINNIYYINVLHYIAKLNK
ncbi:uncharacterized protein METZ01_LOCUS354541 [marine metagenome]|uniref:Uncharacterized protein n=1 Tax=marine metagenome TaxID=408172 RepID=A0A382RXC7_9ZZZZ